MIYMAVAALGFATVENLGALSGQEAPILFNDIFHREAVTIPPWLEGRGVSGRFAAQGEKDRIRKQKGPILSFLWVKPDPWPGGNSTSSPRL